MIDCKRCHDLIDADLAGSLDAKDRSAMAVHLRTCHDCVGYKSKRLQDSSILRRPVAELKDAPPPEPPPPPPPRRPSPLPWILTAAGLILATAAGILLLRDDGDGETDDPGRDRKPVAHRATGPESNTPEPTPPPAVTDPAGSTPAKPKWPIIAVMTDGRPTAAAWLGVASGVQPSATTERLRTDPAGIVELRAPLRYPVFVTAWTPDNVSQTARIDRPGGVALHLGPADSIGGTVSLESAGMVQSIVASWAGGGRSVGLVDSDGRFRILVPSPRPALELRAWSDDDTTFALTPGPLALSTSVEDDVALRAVRAHRLTVRLSPSGPALRHAVATAIGGRTFTLEATAGPGGAAETLTALLPAGDYRIEIVRRGLKRFERTLSIAEPTAFEASFEPSPFSASGVITLSPSGELLGDAVIRPVSSPTARSAETRAPWSTTWTTERWWPPWQTGTTAPIGADGMFTAKGLPWDQVTIEAGDDARFAFGPFSLPAENLRLDLRADASVFGAVRDGAGNPVPGVEVNLESAGVTRRILTNGEGFYEFSGAVVGPTFVYPRAVVGEFASGRESRTAYEVVTTAGGKHQRDFNLPGVTAADIAITDPHGNAFASSIVVNTTDGREVATVAPDSDPNRPFRLPPLTAGTYLAHMIENEVVYPLGRVTLPGRLERVLRRDGPRLEVTCAWGASTPPARAALLIVRRNGETVSQFIVAIGAAHSIGGLLTGRYHLELRYGAQRAFGVADLVDGRPIAPLTLTIR